MWEICLPLQDEQFTEGVASHTACQEQSTQITANSKFSSKKMFNHSLLCDPRPGLPDSPQDLKFHFFLKKWEKMSYCPSYTWRNFSHPLQLGSLQEFMVPFVEEAAPLVPAHVHPAWQREAGTRRGEWPHICWAHTEHSLQDTACQEINQFAVIIPKSASCI